jgi:5-methyltetrahydrofolate--homocysteine methyltransferase
MKEDLVNAIADMKEEEALKLAQAMLDAGEEPQTVLDAGREAMTLIGNRYDAKEYFLPELIIAGDMLKAIGDIVKPKLREQATQNQPQGKVVLGTVAGDIHDLGKDVVSFMLDVNNFEVHDLGVDVAAEKFIQAIQTVKPDVVGLSGFLTLAFDQMRVTVEAIKEAGLRDNVKIMIGGAIMDDNAAKYVGADAYGADAAAAVKLANCMPSGSSALWMWLRSEYRTGCRCSDRISCIPTPLPG